MNENIEAMRRAAKSINEQAAELQRNTVKHTYCKPWNAGLASATKAVEKRLGKLLDALSDEINSNICDNGDYNYESIVEDVFNFKLQLIEKLREDGWEVKVPKNSFKVRSLTVDPF